MHYFAFFVCLNVAAKSSKLFYYSLNFQLAEWFEAAASNMQNRCKNPYHTLFYSYRNRIFFVSAPSVPIRIEKIILMRLCNFSSAERDATTMCEVRLSVWLSRCFNSEPLKVEMR